MSWRCLLRGHCWTLHLEHGWIYLVCARCAVRTQGWNVTVYEEDR